MLKEIRERVKVDDKNIKQGAYPFNTKQVFKDRAELLKLVDEAEKHILNLSRPYPSSDQFKKAEEFLKKLEGEAGE